MKTVHNLGVTALLLIASGIQKLDADIPPPPPPPPCNYVVDTANCFCDGGPQWPQLCCFYNYRDYLGQPQCPPFVTGPNCYYNPGCYQNW